MKTSQQGFIPILIALIAVLVVGGGAAYYKVSTKSSVETKTDKNVPPQNTQNTQAEKPAAVKPTPTQPAQSTPKPAVSANVSAGVAGTGPKATFLKMHAEIESLKTMDEYFALSLRYASQADLPQLAQSKIALDTTPEATKAFLFKTVMGLLPKISDITSITETINGDTATLVMTTNIVAPIGNVKEPLTGRVTMKMEGGVWKMVGAENWSNRAAN